MTELQNKVANLTNAISTIDAAGVRSSATGARLFFELELLLRMRTLAPSLPVPSLERCHI